jgi:hypothetical protein
MRTSLIAAFFILGFFSTCYVSVTYAQEKTVTLPTDTSHSVLKPVDTTQTNQTVPLTNPLKAKSLEALLGDILQFVIRIGAVIVVLMLVYVGFKFVVAQGDGPKLTEARQMFLWTIVGALILLGAQVIASGISATVNALKAG